MDITKIEAGAIKPYIEEMILAPVLEKAVKTHQFSTKKHKIILNLIDTDTIVLADMYMLQRILNNLINNAIKYSPEGGSIIISAEKKEDMCLISIKDEGLGISEEDQKHIFERFKRSSSKKKNRVWGSGVGLFIVKTLISSINGNIRVESQLGKGTTFFLTLPLYKNEGEIK
jgi:signal transduction histidine kinase